MKVNRRDRDRERESNKEEGGIRRVNYREFIKDIKGLNRNNRNWSLKKDIRKIRGGEERDRNERLNRNKNKGKER